MRHLLSDVRFTFRMLRRSPGFFATLLCVLIAGIGATTAMFSIVESVLLRPLPYPHADELTVIWRADQRVDPGPASIPDFLDWKAQSTTFERMAAVEYTRLSLSSAGAKPEALEGARVSGEFFPIFEVHPLQGRLLTPEDDRLGGPRVAVLSASLWHRRFGSDPSVVGRSITLDSVLFTVVGIAPERFVFAGPYSGRTDVWSPLTTRATYATDATQRGDHFIHVMGRRKPGVSLEAAQAELKGIAKNLEAAYPDSNAKKGVRLEDLHAALVGASRSNVWVLFAAVALVFVIVCANVASLLLTRAQSRRAEMAARAALGATPSRLAKQVVTETVVVFLIGAIGGYLASRSLVDIFAAGVVDGSGARSIPVRVDAVALLFSILTCLGAGVLFGLVPALAVARVEPQAVLKESAARAGVGRSQRTVRSALVVGQVAVACALLVGSGLTLKAFAKMAATKPGFDPTDVATARVVLPEIKYADSAKAAGFYRELLARIAARPDVTAVAGNSSLPMAGSNWSGSFQIEGGTPWLPGEQPNLERGIISPGYFAAMGTPILRGREFTQADRREGRLVMVLNQNAAERFFPGQDPIGRRIDWGETDDDKAHTWREIVGIVADVRRNGLSRPPVPESYAPIEQHPNLWMMIVIRSPRAPALLQELPSIVASVDPEQAISGRRLMTDIVADSVGSQRYVAILLSAFASAALLLATLGVFGLVSYTTGRRTRELGIRMALGSTPEAVVRLVMGGGARLLAFGIGIGLAGAAVVGRVLAGRIFGVAAFDLGIYAAIPAILGITGLVACLIPAWRAVRIPPAIALGYD